MLDLDPNGLYKVTRDDGTCTHGSGRWDVGVRRSADGPLVPCENGIHLCRPQHLVHWLGAAIHPVVAYDEVDLIEQDDKLVVRWAELGPRLSTWNDTTMRLFACDCAEHVLKARRDDGKAPDGRSWAALEVSRRYARGTATAEELRKARADAAAAARKQEREWQSAQLWQYLTGEVS